MDTTLMECLRWEREHGYLSEADYTRLLTEGIPATARVALLQEGRPTSYGKDAPMHLPTPNFSDGLDLTPYIKRYGAPGAKPPTPTPTPAPRALKDLSETVLTEARAQLFEALTDKPAERKLPANIHQRLARAVRGY